MFCGNCSLQMPDGTIVCPRCGRVNSLPESGVRQSNASVAQPNRMPPLPTANYGMGRNPYEVPPPPPYGGNPYDVTATPSSYTPPPVSPYFPSQPPVSPIPPRKPRNKQLFLIIGSVLVVLVVLFGVSVYFLSTITNARSQQERGSAQSGQSTGLASTDPAQNPYPPKTGTLVMDDPMHDNSKGYKWDEATMNSNNSNSFCGYKLGNYHVSKGIKGAVICDPEAPQLALSNLAFEVNVTVTQGKEAGLVARFDQIKAVGYVFSVTTDGRYFIDTMDLNNKDSNKHFNILRQGSNAAIKQGLNQSNLLAIVANGSYISAFINNQFIDSLQDTSFTNGQVGIYGYGDTGLDIAAQNARVWRI